MTLRFAGEESLGTPCLFSLSSHYPSIHPSSWRAMASIVMASDGYHPVEKEKKKLILLLEINKGTLI